MSPPLLLESSKYKICDMLLLLLLLLLLSLFEFVVVFNFDEVFVLDENEFARVVVAVVDFVPVAVVVPSGSP